MTINRLCGSVLLFSLLISLVPDRSLLSLYNEEDTKVSHFPKVSQPSSLHHMILLISQGVMNYETVFPRNVSSWIRFFSQFFCFCFCFFDEDKLKFPISAEEEQGVLILSTRSQFCITLSHHNVKMRHVIMHHAPPKPLLECCFFFINIEVLFIATVAVSGGQCSEKSCSGRWLSGVE